MSIFNPFTWFGKKKAKPPKGSYAAPIDGKPPSNNTHLERRPSQPSEEGQTLSDIVRGIAHAAGAANEIQDRQFIQQVNHYFHKEEDGTLVPKVVRCKIDETNYIEVPLISMIDPSTLGLEEMDVRMGVRLSRAEVKSHIHDANREKNVSRSSFNVSLTSSKPGDRQDVIDVTMKFKKTEPAEGSARLIEEMNGLAQPHKYDETTAEPSQFTNIFTSSINRKPQQPDDIDHDSESFEPHHLDDDHDDGLKSKSESESSSSESSDSSEEE